MNLINWIRAVERLYWGPSEAEILVAEEAVRILNAQACEVIGRDLVGDWLPDNAKDIVVNAAIRHLMALHQYKQGYTSEVSGPTLNAEERRAIKAAYHGVDRWR